MIAALISFCISCRKGRIDPDTETQGTVLFDLTVYDSDAWTPERRLPVAADVEVEIFELYHIDKWGRWTEGDSVVSVFSGKTDSRGVVSVMKADTVKGARITYLARLKKGTRSNYSPDGFLCGGVFESEEEIRWSPLQPGGAKVGDKKLVDFNGDGLICCIYDKPIYGDRVWYSGGSDEPASCWLY